MGLFTTCHCIFTNLHIANKGQELVLGNNEPAPFTLAIREWRESAELFETDFQDLIKALDIETRPEQISGETYYQCLDQHLGEHDCNECLPLEDVLGGYKGLLRAALDVQLTGEDLEYRLAVALIYLFCSDEGNHWVRAFKSAAKACTIVETWRRNIHQRKEDMAKLREESGKRLVKMKRLRNTISKLEKQVSILTDENRSLRGETSATASFSTARSEMSDKTSSSESTVRTTPKSDEGKVDDWLAFKVAKDGKGGNKAR